MAIYDEEVTKKVGKDELDLILEAVIAGHIDSTKMQDIAQKCNLLHANTNVCSKLQIFANIPF